MTTTAPLSKSQYGLYVECAQHPGEAYYNIPYLYTFDGSLDENRLKAAIETAVAAHPTLFTRIELNEQGEPVQTIDDSEKMTLEVEHISDIRAAIQGFIQPFDIYKDHFFRMRMLRDDEHYYWLLDIHHIIGDGTSLKVLLADIEAAYEGKELTPEVIMMGEMALEEEEQRQTARFEEDKQWYAQNFDCGDCFSTLLPDLDGVTGRDCLTRTMNVDTAKVDAFCREHGIFKSTFFTAAYSFLLAKMNNEQEVLFNTIHNGRSDKRLLHSVGMFVKTLPVYAKFDNDTTVLDFLKAGQDQMSGCRQHEAYAFSDAVNDLGLQTATLFAWHGTLFDNLEFGGKPMKSERLNNNTLASTHLPEGTDSATVTTAWRQSTIPTYIQRGSWSASSWRAMRPWWKVSSLKEYLLRTSILPTHHKWNCSTRSTRPMCRTMTLRPSSRCSAVRPRKHPTTSPSFTRTSAILIKRWTKSATASQAASPQKDWGWRMSSQYLFPAASGWPLPH